MSRTNYDFNRNLYRGTRSYDPPEDPYLFMSPKRLNDPQQVDPNELPVKRPDIYEQIRARLANRPEQERLRAEMARNPRREDYKPNAGNRIGAIMSGFAAGWKNPREGYELSTEMLEHPYTEAQKEHDRRLRDLAALAGMESDTVRAEIEGMRDQALQTHQDRLFGRGITEFDRTENRLLGDQTIRANIQLNDENSGTSRLYNILNQKETPLGKLGQTPWEKGDQSVDIYNRTAGRQGDLNRASEEKIASANVEQRREAAAARAAATRLRYQMIGAANPSSNLASARLSNLEANDIQTEKYVRWNEEEKRYILIPEASRPFGDYRTPQEREIEDRERALVKDALFNENVVKPPVGKDTNLPPGGSVWEVGPDGVAREQRQGAPGVKPPSGAPQGKAGGNMPISSPAESLPEPVSSGTSQTSIGGGATGNPPAFLGGSATRWDPTGNNPVSGQPMTSSPFFGGARGGGPNYNLSGIDVPPTAPISEGITDLGPMGRGIPPPPMAPPIPNLPMGGTPIGGPGMNLGAAPPNKMGLPEIPIGRNPILGPGMNFGPPPPPSSPLPMGGGLPPRPSGLNLGGAPPPPIPPLPMGQVPLGQNRNAAPPIRPEALSGNREVPNLTLPPGLASLPGVNPRPNATGRVPFVPPAPPPPSRTDVRTGSERAAFIPKGLKRSYSRYDNTIQQKSEQYKVPTLVTHALIQQESKYDPYAVSDATPAAEGLMQIRPIIQKAFKVKDPFDPTQNLDGGLQFLSQLIKKYKGDMPVVFAAYHSGEPTVDKWLKSRKEGETSLKGLGPKTRAYVSKVMSNLRRLEEENR